MSEPYSGPPRVSDYVRHRTPLPGKRSVCRQRGVVTRIYSIAVAEPDPDNMWEPKTRWVEMASVCWDTVQIKGGRCPGCYAYPRDDLELVQPRREPEKKQVIDHNAEAAADREAFLAGQDRAATSQYAPAPEGRDPLIYATGLQQVLAETPDGEYVTIVEQGTGKRYAVLPEDALEAILEERRRLREGTVDADGSE